MEKGRVKHEGHTARPATRAHVRPPAADRAAHAAPPPTHPPAHASEENRAMHLPASAMGGRATSERHQIAPDHEAESLQPPPAQPAWQRVSEPEQQQPEARGGAASGRPRPAPARSPPPPLAPRRAPPHPLQSSTTPAPVLPVPTPSAAHARPGAGRPAQSTPSRHQRGLQGPSGGREGPTPAVRRPQPPATGIWAAPAAAAAPSSAAGRHGPATSRMGEV